MKPTIDQVRVLLDLQGLRVPEDELGDIALRLTTWTTALEEAERAIGPRVDEVDPVPPVFPHPDW